MTKARPSFGKAKVTEDWYDMFEDWPLIEASFAMQYGIRIRQEQEMSWDEFCTLLSGLNSKTPLGQMIDIRSENNPETLKAFTAEQRKTRSDYRSKSARNLIQNSPETARAKIDEFQSAMKAAFSKK